MTPADLTDARKRLRLTGAALGRILELGGRDPGRYVRAWEAGEHPIPGPVRVAVRYMLAEHARQKAQEATLAKWAADAAFADAHPIVRVPEALEPHSAIHVQPQPRKLVTTRRRGA